MQGATSAGEADVRVELVAPPTLAPGTPATLVYRLAEAGTGAPLSDLVVSHERPMHLIVVSRDLREFQHLHPEPTGQPGEFAVEVQLPTAGTYILYDELTRANGQDVVQRDELTVGAPTSAAAALVEDRAPKVVGGIRVSLRDGGPIRAGQETQRAFRLEDDGTGQGVRDLQPYLGAPAHVVVLSEDAGTFAHTHGEQVGAVRGSHAGDHWGGHGTAYGPEIGVHHTFPTPGLYKLWGQFQTGDGHVVTADFVVRAE